MKPNRLTTEIALFILAFSLAIGVRFYQLGSAPLTDTEASWALQARQLDNSQVNGSTSLMAPLPAYVILTAITFFLMGSSNFLARFWPAIFGSLLILLPLYYRKEIGRYPALILTFALALDPGMVTVSRQAGSPMLALSAILWAITLWKVRKPTLAGIFAGLALLSGPAILIGGLGLGLALAIYHFAMKSFPKNSGEMDNGGFDAPSVEKHSRIHLQELFISAVLTFLLVGSLFFRYPQGLGIWFNTIPVYFKGWLDFSGIPAAKLVVALFSYTPLAIIFSLVAVGRWLIQSGASSVSVQHIEEQARRLALPLLWLILSLFLSLLYPARQTADLCWSLVPLWALASIELGEYIPEAKTHIIAPIQALLLSVMSALFWITLTTTEQEVVSVDIPFSSLHFILILGIFILAALTTLLVALGWSWRLSRLGLVWGTTLALSCYSFGLMWGASHLRANFPQELWSPPPGPGQVDLMLETLSDLSEWNKGMPDYLDIVSTVDTPSLRWAMRDSHNLRFVSSLPLNVLPANETPDILITLTEQETPQFSSSYRGQDFVWWVQPGWTGVLPEDLISWLAFKDAPLQMDKIILWARNDLFPGGAFITPGQP